MYDIFDLNFNTTTGNETEQVETNISLKQFPNPDFFFLTATQTPKIYLL